MAIPAGSPDGHEAPTARPLVAIVDDDESVRESLPDLLRGLGFAATAFESAEAFLSSRDMTQAKCMLLDVRMPGMSGPELQRELVARGIPIAIIFMTARSTASERKRLMQLGAGACLFKPFSVHQLQSALNAALQ